MLHCRGTGDRRGHPKGSATTKHVAPLRWQLGWGRACGDLSGAEPLAVFATGMAKASNYHSVSEGSICFGCPAERKGFFSAPHRAEEHQILENTTLSARSECMNKTAPTPFCCRGGGSPGDPPALRLVAVCSRAGCHSLGSRCPTARTGEQRTVHGSIDREVRRVKQEHLVRRCPAPAKGLPRVY